MHLNADPSKTFDPALRFGLGMERLDDIFTLEKASLDSKDGMSREGQTAR